MEVKEESHEGLMSRWAAASNDVRHGLRMGDDQDGFLGHLPVPPSGDFRFLSSTPSQAQRNATERPLPPAQPMISSQSRPDPALRSNSGSHSPPRLGDANRDMGVAKRVCTPTPSTEEYFTERGSKEAMVGRDLLEYSGGVPVRFHKGRESLSVQRNVTIRDSKRPKVRSSDEDYRRRVSSSPATMRLALEAYNGVSMSLGHHRGNDSRGESHTYPTPHFDGSSGGNGARDPFGLPKRGGPLLGHEVFEINLVHEGQRIRTTVTTHMRVLQLRDNAASLLGLEPLDLILVVFGMNPRTLGLTEYSLLSDSPPVLPEATILIFRVGGSARNHGVPPAAQHQPANHGPNPFGTPHQPASFSAGSKFLGNFKLTNFDGTARSWKQWDKSFVRFLSIHQLDHVIEESFLAVLPLSTQDFQANKMVYYLLEDAIIQTSLAAKYFRQAAKWNGNEAYSRLHDGYVFSGPQTMTLLLAELVNMRFKSDESASGFCLRLREIFEDLEMIPGPSSLTLNDTQKIGYLLSGIRQEKALQAVYVALQDKQLRGSTTFEDACEDLFHRCEAIRADELLNTPVRGQQKALVSTKAKRHNTGSAQPEMAPCLEKGCSDLVKVYLPLCQLHYHQCVSGKTPEVELKDGLGKAKYNLTTQIIDYPAAVPKNRFPTPRSERKVLVSNTLRPGPSSVMPLLLGQPGPAILDYKPTTSDFATFYVESGAGQCLCSCASAFATMEACHVQVVGVAGRLNIHGQGTAMFLVCVEGDEIILRIHNCLHSFCEFNLISVSQLKLLP
jgi:hypothetical protein